MGSSIGTILGGAAGFALGGPAGASLGASLGGSFDANRAADKANAQAVVAQQQAGQLAAEESRFRPVGITTRFGQSGFSFDPMGRLSGAAYTTSPEIQALQDRLTALYGTSLGQAEQAAAAAAPLGAAAQGLFGLGQQYLGESPEAVRQRVFEQQQALLDPVRQREEARLGAGVFGRGRAGLSVGSMGQPELFALAQARRQQDLQLAADAERQAQQQITFGQGLFTGGAGLQADQYRLPVTAMAPFTTQFGAVESLEKLGMQPLEVGAALGGRAVNTAGASALGQTGLAAAQTQLAGRQAAITSGQDLLSDFLGRLNFGSPNTGIYNQRAGVNFTDFGVYG